MTVPVEEPQPPVSRVVEWLATFLLVLSVVMLPFVAAEEVHLRLLTLLLGLAAGFCWLLKALFEGAVSVPRGGFFAGLVLFLAAGIVSGVASDCPQKAVVTLLTWAGYITVFLLAMRVGRGEALRLRITRALCAMAVPIAVCGILQYAFILDITRLGIESGRFDAEIRMRFSEQDRPWLLQRTISKRVYGTFTLPNSLAGFLLVTIPPAAGFLAMRGRRGARPQVAAFLIIALAGFFLTFSKGGWLVAAAMIVAFALLWGRTWLRHRWRLALAVLAAALIAVSGAAALSPTLRGRLRSMKAEFAGSQRVRSQYWAAALSMWRANPVLGVGPGNFENHYTAHMLVTGEETRSAHNDYVQVLAECGPLALAGYVLFWGSWLVAVVRRRAEDGTLASAAHTPRRERAIGLVDLAGVVAIAMAGFLGTLLTIHETSTWANAAGVLLFALMWWATYRAFGRIEASAESSHILTTSLLLGALGFALHSLVDLDLYVEGVACTAFVAAGLALAPRARWRTLPVRGAVQLPAIAVLSVLMLLLFYGASRVCEGGIYRVRGMRLLLTDPAGARDALEAGCQKNPLDHQLWADLARAWAHIGASSESFENARNAWLNAIRLNPWFSEYRDWFGRLLFDVASDRPGLVERLVAGYSERLAALALPSPPLRIYIPALVEYREAVRLAPTKPAYRVRYGDMLAAAGVRAAAVREFIAALDLNEMMRRGGAPQRQLLPDAQVEYARARLRQLSSP